MTMMMTRIVVHQLLFYSWYLFTLSRLTEDSVCFTAAEKTDQRKSEEAFLKAARDGSHEAVTTMVILTN